PAPEPLAVTSSEWKRLPDGQEIVTLEFSGRVESESLQRHVAVTVPDEATAVSFEVVPEGARQTLSLRLTTDVSSAEQVMLNLAAGFADTTLHVLPEDTQITL